MPTDYNPLPALLKGIKISPKDRTILCARIVQELIDTKYAMKLSATHMLDMVQHRHSVEMRMLSEAFMLALNSKNKKER